MIGLNKKLKNGLIATGAVLGTTFAVMSYIAKKQRDNDKYKNDSSEQNPMYKKKVIFVEDENDPINADGKQGHLEAVGERDYIPTFYEKYVKRGIDVILSFGGMVVLAPVYAVTAIAIKLDSPGPVIFKQKRIAQQTGYFTLPKFRSMAKASDVPTHMLQESGGQSNITAVGKVIRRLSIDELPQLWNVLRGDMSFVGYRPERQFFINQIIERNPDYVLLYCSRPGITSAAAVHNGYTYTIDQMLRRLDMDLDYLRHRTLWTDLRIMFETLTAL